MTAYKIACTVIPERQDDTLSAKFLVVAPEDRIVWVATTTPGLVPDFGPEERKRSVAQAGIKSLMSKMQREVVDGDILELADRQIDCRDRNFGKCGRYPQLAVAHSNCPEGAIEALDEDDCYPGVLECWMLEEEVD